MRCDHGNDKYNFDGHIEVDFSSNVWCRSMPSSFFLGLQNALFAISDYPHPYAADLINMLADFHGLSAGNVCVSNGSVEGIYLLARAFSGKRSAIIYPCFSEYEEACYGFDHHLRFYPNEQFLSTDFNGHDLVWLGNPNNPDGKVFPVSEIENLLVRYPSVLFAIDEAFDRLCTGFESSAELIKKYKNLIVVRSFTKAFAIPGLRLGYVLAPGWVCDKIKKLAVPWSVNSLAISAGKLILENYNTYSPDLNDLKKQADYLLNQLEKFPQLMVTPSSCNFFMVKTQEKTAIELKQYLATQHRILIRDASGFRGLDETCFRLSVQPEENTDRLINALNQYFK